jgi:hypothetical protein
MIHFLENLFSFANKLLEHSQLLGCKCTLGGRFCFLIISKNQVQLLLKGILLEKEVN